MSGSKSQRKGKQGERELEKILTNRGFDVMRGAKAQADSSSGDVKLPDLIMRAGNYTMSIEVKRHAKVGVHHIRGGYEQAVSGAVAILKHKLGKPPIGYAVAHRSNHDEWFVTMDLNTFLALLRGEMYGVSEVIDFE